MEHGNSRESSMQESSTSSRQPLHVNVKTSPPLPTYRPPKVDASNSDQQQRTSTSSQQLMTKLEELQGRLKASREQRKLEELQERLKASREQRKSSSHNRSPSASTISTCPSLLSFESPTVSSLSSSLTLDTQQVQQAKEQWQQPLEQHKSASSPQPIQEEVKNAEQQPQQQKQPLDIQQVQQKPPSPPPVLKEINEIKDEADDNDDDQHKAASPPQHTQNEELKVEVDDDDDLISLGSAIHLPSRGDVETGTINNTSPNTETPHERISKLKEEALDYLSKIASEDDASLMTTTKSDDDGLSVNASSDNDSDANPDEITAAVKEENNLAKKDEEDSKETGDNTTATNLVDAVYTSSVESLQRQWEEPPPELAPLGDDPTGAANKTNKDNGELHDLEEGKAPNKSVSFAADESNTVRLVERRMTLTSRLRRLVRMKKDDSQEASPAPSKVTRNCLLLTFANLFLAGGAAAIVFVIYSIAK